MLTQVGLLETHRCSQVPGAEKPIKNQRIANVAPAHSKKKYKNHIFGKISLYTCCLYHPNRVIFYGFAESHSLGYRAGPDVALR